MKICGMVNFDLVNMYTKNGVLTPVTSRDIESQSWDSLHCPGTTEYWGHIRYLPTPLLVFVKKTFLFLVLWFWKKNLSTLKWGLEMFWDYFQMRSNTYSFLVKPSTKLSSIAHLWELLSVVQIGCWAKFDRPYLWNHWSDQGALKTVLLFVSRTVGIKKHGRYRTKKSKQKRKLNQGNHSVYLERKHWKP